MDSKWKIALPILLLIGATLLIILLAYPSGIPVLFPDGLIGEKQRDLLVIATELMLIVVIPVFVLAFVFVKKYRSENTKATYTPDWDDHPVAECIWWGLPCLIILALGIITYKSSYALDPFKPIASMHKPIKIQVVALNWKWLFIYPEYNIASINHVQFPENTPLAFEITADAPMNSFWIPALGGQIFAMPGMSTKLHLIANKKGNFNGVSANLSGEGFAGMSFLANSCSQEEFNVWVNKVHASPHTLNKQQYKTLIEPSKYHPVTLYRLEDAALYDWIVMKYMMPMSDM